jgi:hypothetical protein
MRQADPNLRYYDYSALQACEAGYWFEHAIAGVSMPSRDGHDRQALVQTFVPRQELFLVREPNNEFDRNAIKIVDQYGRSPGYVSAKPADWWGIPGGLAGFLAERMDKGEVWRAFVVGVFGGKPMYGKPTWGCRVCFVMLKGAPFSLTSRLPLGEQTWRDDGLPFPDDAAAMLATIMPQAGALPESWQAYLAQVSFAVNRFGGAPLVVRNALRGLLGLPALSEIVVPAQRDHEPQPVAANDDWDTYA